MNIPVQLIRVRRPNTFHAVKYPIDNNFPRQEIASSEYAVPLIATAIEHSYAAGIELPCAADIVGQDRQTFVYAWGGHDQISSFELIFGERWACRHPSSKMRSTQTPNNSLLFLRVTRGINEDFKIHANLADRVEEESFIAFSAI
ncbi:hypothetical protein NKI34_28975 [Mesorhizobium sp. M0700]|uniref:hypothetical protein n=1 Tax=Mesorhizobium sp. M0700 TaxID=2956988 RepID=UPI0033392C48